LPAADAIFGKSLAGFAVQQDDVAIRSYHAVWRHEESGGYPTGDMESGSSVK
jgi:hypothetical protein